MSGPVWKSDKDFFTEFSRKALNLSSSFPKTSIQTVVNAIDYSGFVKFVFRSLVTFKFEQTDAQSSFDKLTRSLQKRSQGKRKSHHVCFFKTNWMEVMIRAKETEL
ncbi:hypothetical protein J437_LFUL011324 [Ladona fulva]|uniref:Uncharacterized protein n=1 Tax=Ladona fulva TaxID=123851 RepID=A0A8K0KFI0_LADFU|nr:hypothetical protein J437_LFUL011324 [Ladona fulva]